MAILAPLLLATLTVAMPAQESQPPSIQSLFESGQYTQLIERVHAEEAPPPDQLYLAGLSARKLSPPDNDQARNWFGRLGADDANAWAWIGKSATAVVAGDKANAVAGARKAVELASDSFYAQYQLGLALAEANDFGSSAAALEKATTLNPSFAYGHYYAGMAYYKARRVDKMSTFFERFLKLAPKAPERPAIESLMKSVRGK